MSRSSVPAFPGAARLHAPLALQALLLAGAGPVLQHALARAADPAPGIAAFWLAFSLATLFQSGALAVQPAALAGWRQGVTSARIVTGALAIGLLTGGALLAAGAAAEAGAPVLRWTGVTADVQALAGRVLVALAPLPIAIAIRGVLAAHLVATGRTEWLAASGVLRLALLASASAMLAGALAAAHAVLFAAAGELVMLGVAASRPGAARVARRHAHAASRSFRACVLPVVAGLLAWSAVRPLVGAVLGALAHPLAAQAAFGAVLPLLMLAGSPVWCFFEVTLATPDDRDSTRALVLHAGAVAMLLSAAVLFAASPFARDGVLGTLCGVPVALRPAVREALPILALLPPVLATRAIAGALLLRHGRARAAFALAPVRLGVVALAGFALARVVPEAPGALLGVGLVVAGDALDAALAVTLLARGHARETAPGAEAGREPEREAA